MTRLHSGSVTRPRFETRPYKPSAARREHIFGKVQPLHEERMCGLQWVSNGIVIGLFGVTAVLCAARGWSW